MSKLTKHPDGSMSYDSEGTPAPHVGQSRDKEIDRMASDISNIYSLINGDGEYKGTRVIIELMDEKLNGLIHKQNNNRGWAMLLVSVFSLLILGLGYIGVTDHNAVTAIPELLKQNYYNKESTLMMMENQSKLNLIFDKANLNNEKDIEAIRKELIYYDKTFEYLRITRGEKNTTKK